MLKWFYEFPNIQIYIAPDEQSLPFTGMKQETECRILVHLKFVIHMYFSFFNISTFKYISISCNKNNNIGQYCKPQMNFSENEQKSDTLKKS